MKFYRIVLTQTSLTHVSVRQERWEPDMEEWVEVKQTYKMLRGWKAAMEYAEVLSRSVVDEIVGSK